MRFMGCFGLRKPAKILRKRHKDTAELEQTELPLQSYLAACVQTRGAVQGLVSGYSPTDNRFAAYTAEARALWHIRDRLAECHSALQGVHC
jgi:hypothetical protein